MAARTATIKKSIATLAHAGVFTITTGDIAAVVPGATVSGDVVQPQTLTLYANGGSVSCATTIVTGALRVAWDGGTNEEALPAGDYYIDVSLIDEADVASLTDSTGGTPGATLAASTSTYDAAIINDNVATLNAKIDELIVKVNGLV